MRELLFIGERPSLTAYKNGYGPGPRGDSLHARCSAALRKAGIDPETVQFKNLFGDNPWADMSKAPWWRVRMIRKAAAGGKSIVAMGQKVARELKRHDIRHIELTHPAARGVIRGRARYVKHVKERLAA